MTSLGRGGNLGNLESLQSFNKLINLGRNWELSDVFEGEVWGCREVLGRVVG